MARSKKEKLTISGGQLLARGDIVRVMEDGNPVRCRVLACVAAEEGACLASLEIMEGARAGERIKATLKAAAEEPPSNG